MKSPAETVDVTMEEVIRTGFMVGDPDALTRARQLRAKYLETAANLVSVANRADAQAAEDRNRARNISRIITEYQPHWTPRVGDAAEGVPTPETVVKSRKRQHDPIQTLYSNKKITERQKRAAEIIATIFEAVTKPVNFKPRNLEAGRPPKHTGPKPVMLADDIAIEHRLVYKPWAEAVHLHPRLSLPLAIAIIVDATPLRDCRERFHMKHDTVVDMLKGALDLYIKIDKGISDRLRERLEEPDKE